jgi:UDP-3-O-[3-hydroxymyristoyl] glucosamine N-acyltransferase
MKLIELANQTKSELERGDENLEIKSASALEIARQGEVTFLSNPKYTKLVASTKASAIFLRQGEKIEREDIAILRAPDSYLAFTRALRFFNPEQKLSPRIDPKAVIHSSAKISEGVEIHPNVVIGANTRVGKGTRIFPNVTIYEGATIGEDCTIHSGVSIRENCEIGNRVIIHNNTTIGCDGFGFAKDENRHWLKIPQTGKVVIEDDVEIGANTAIDRASVGESRIKRGVKIDNLVQIGHSCSIDEDALICAQTGLAGSSHIGKRTILAGQVGIAGHLKVGDDVVITAKSATSHDVESGKIISGIPAFDNREWLRSIAAFRRLGDIARKIRQFEEKR